MIGFRWFWAILTLVVMATVSPATGQMRALDDQAMADTYAGTTLAIQAPAVDLAMGFDSLAFSDPDGTGDGRPGNLTLAGFSLTGAILMHAPLSMNMGGFISLINGNPQTGLDLTIEEMTIRIDRLSVDAIQVGYGPGMGQSFGSIALTNWVTRISGHIQIHSY